MEPLSAKTCSQDMIKWYYPYAGNVVLTDKQLVLREVVALKP
jgi:hypothetical protein